MELERPARIALLRSLVGIGTEAAEVLWRRPSQRNVMNSKDEAAVTEKAESRSLQPRSSISQDEGVDEILLRPVEDKNLQSEQNDY